MSGVVQAGTRPLRIYGLLLLGLSAVFAVATIVCAISIAGTGTTVVGQGVANQPITLSTARATGPLHVLAATAAGASTTTQDSCRLSGDHPRTTVSSDFSVSGATTYADRTYQPFVKIGAGWDDGDQVTCSGPHLEGLLVIRQNRTPRILLTALLAFITIGSGVLGLAGAALRRRPS